MKKIIAIMLVLSIALCLAACGGKTPEGLTKADKGSQSEETVSGKTETTTETTTTVVVKEQTVEMLGKILEFAPGTAGSSLKLRGIAYALLKYSVDEKLCDEDQKTVDAQVEAAFKKLDRDQQERILDFVEGGEGGVFTVIYNALTNYKEQKGLFEDAGVPEMEKLVKAEKAAECWEKLANALADLG